MSIFYIALTLSTLTGPQIVWFGPEQHFSDAQACYAALPQVTKTVEHIIRDDPASLKYFGTLTDGKLTRGYFVSDASCNAADTAPGAA